MLYGNFCPSLLIPAPFIYHIKDMSHEDRALFLTELYVFSRDNLKLTTLARKKKQLPVLEKVTITDVAAEGKAIARVNDMVVFVSGRKSSNGKELYEHCRQVNPRTYFVTSPDDLDGLELDLTQRIGICGATSRR